MVNRSKRIGTFGETETVKAFERAGLKAHRPALRGTLDHGDVWAANGAIVVEVKAGEQTQKPSWNLIRAWWAETEKESTRVAACDVALLVVRRWGSGHAEDWTAYIDLPDLVWLLTGRTPRVEEMRWALIEPVAVRLGNLLPLMAAQYGEAVA